MRSTPSINRFLFIFYLIFTMGVLLFAFVSPEAQRVAPAPLRDALQGSPEPISVTLLASTEKTAWLEQAMAAFEQSDMGQVHGRDIDIQLQQTGSFDLVRRVVEGDRPVLVSPASSLQVALLEEQSRAAFGTPLVQTADTNGCQRLVQTPLVLVAWQARADALWDGQPPERLWLHLHDVVVDSQGWNQVGQPEWGFVKFSHTDPTRSYSGLMTLLLMTYDYYGKVDGLTSAEILGNADFQTWLAEIEGTISTFGDSTGTYMQEIVAYGPSRHDMVVVYESTAIEQAANAEGRYGTLTVIYPPTTIMSDHPFCVLNGDWVSAEQADAARQFLAFLATPEMQTLALMEHGFRPSSPSVALDQPGSPFVAGTVPGLSQTLPPEVAVPSGDTIDTLMTFWARSVAR